MTQPFDVEMLKSVRSGAAPDAARRLAELEQRAQDAHAQRQRASQLFYAAGALSDPDDELDD